MNLTFLVVAVLALLFVGYVFADTTFDWSDPGNSGTLTYTGLGLSNAVMSGTLTLPGGSVDVPDINITSNKIIMGADGGTGVAVTVSGNISMANNGTASVQGALAEINSVTFTNGSTIATTDGDTLTITETAVNIIGTSDVDGDATATSYTADDDIAATDDLTVGGLSRITPTVQAATNGQVITVADGFYNITSSGLPSGQTNTVTLANPTTAGDIVMIHLLAASTNLLSFADSGNLRLAGAYEMTDDDTLTLIAPSTSIWVEQGRSAN